MVLNWYIKFVYTLTHCICNLFSAPLQKKIFQRLTPKILKTSKSDLYTEEEKQVLLKTSKINNKEYVPFMDVDLLERYINKYIEIIKLW